MANKKPASQYIKQSLTVCIVKSSQFYSNSTKSQLKLSQGTFQKSTVHK